MWKVFCQNFLFTLVIRKWILSTFFWPTRYIMNNECTTKRVFIRSRLFMVLIPNRHIMIGLCCNDISDVLQFNVVRQEKKKWRSLDIFLKLEYMKAQYFEWTWWYALISLLILCFLTHGYARKTFFRLKQNFSWL